MRCIVYSPLWLRAILSSVGQESFLYTYTGVGLSALLVSTTWAMPEPLLRGTSDRTGSTFSCIYISEYKHSHTDARWLQFFSIMGIPNEKLTLEALNNYQGYDVVVREIISKEINCQYSFMKWNIVVQTFLFGAITQLKNDKYLWVITVIGILVSLSSFITYWASEAKSKESFTLGMDIESLKGLSDYAFSPVWAK